MLPVIKGKGSPFIDVPVTVTPCFTTFSGEVFEVFMVSFINKGISVLTELKLLLFISDD